MKIAEIYKSVQGEGFLTGTKSIFIRASGCNLRCHFCDTPFASWKPEGTDLATDAIMAQLAEWDSSHVVITGGEPMLFAELIPLAESIAAAGKHITIETAGTLYLPVRCHLMSISPKLSNSTPSKDDHPAWSGRHERSRHRPDVIRRLIAEYRYQFKFVVQDEEDCDEVAAYLGEIPEIEESRIMLMPQGTDRETLQQVEHWLKPYCKQVGWRYCPRQQIEWFGGVRGT